MTHGERKTEHVDVLIVGAGISGIGGAYHLAQQCPDRSFVVLEGMETFGGTWWTHKYPGVRSDSDLFTFGYRFKPWTGAPIATGEEILRYLGEVIEENDLKQHIRYEHRVTAASWSSDEARWTIDVTRTDTGEELRFSTGFLWMCQGYYRHGEGYVPDWEGLDDFEGEVIHPQLWPEGTDLEGKQVVVIGSGATAATLIPNIADSCEHVTMLQRSPTFFVARPNNNELADQLRELEIPDEWIHEIVRRQLIKMQSDVARMSFEAPDMMREFLVEAIRPMLPEGFDVERHFSPSYRPWQQRLALLPDGDLFTAIREGKASVVTDHVERFDATGIQLVSGDHLDADVVITATGFDLSILGDVEFRVDDEPLDFADTVTYRGLMFTGLPNMAYVFGYFRASWTLRSDLISDFVCRLLNHMDELGVSTVIPVVDDPDMPLGPWVDPDNFNPGYLARSMHLMPKQGDHEPWRLLHDYAEEKVLLPAADLDDGTLQYR